MASSEQEACLRKTTYRRSTGGQKNLNISKAPVACCLTLELERQGGEQTETSWHQVLREEGGLMLQTCHFPISDENESAGESEEVLVA